MVPNKACTCLEGRAWFGAYPSDFILDLQKLNITIYLDVTQAAEKLPGYRHQLRPTDIYYNFPIDDLRVPRPSEARNVQMLLDWLIEGLFKGHRVYIHCRGGHGRSGTIVALLYRRLLGWDADRALLVTNQCHNTRKTMTARMRKIGAPQTKVQKDYVREFTFINIYY